MKAKTLFFISCLLAISSPLLANSELDAKKIVTQGNAQGATACIACHGQNGEGNSAAGYPYLSGLPVKYIRRQLHAFRNGTRNNNVMQPIAKNLSDKQIDMLAAYYTKLTNKKISTRKVTDVGQGTTGNLLANNGKWDVGLPACFKCHGEGGSGITPDFPPIVGQPYKYIKDQLVAFNSGKRKNDPVGLMQAVVKKLNQSEIEEVARYLSAKNSR
jgi:cytochrome c553